MGQTPHTQTPTVSVLIPAYNRANQIGDAVTSILGQSFGDFELVVIDDGSSDETVKRVEAFGDPRIRIVRHERNRGIPHARNSGLDAARGRFIAWLDSDDIARPRRLARQIAFMEAHPSVAMVGCAAGKIRKDGRRKPGIRIPPTQPDDIAAWLLFRSAFQQSSVMGRAEVLKDFPYQPEFDVCEDLDVFLRLSRAHPLANLPEVLIDRRLHPDQTVRLRQSRIRERKTLLYAEPLARLGMSPTEEDLRRHTLLGKTRLSQADFPPDFLAWAQHWLSMMGKRNLESRYLDTRSLAFATGWFWLLACRSAVPACGHATAVRAWLGSPLSRNLAGRHALAWFRQSAPVLMGIG